MNIGKEASNPNMTQQARLNTWKQTHLERFAAADRALTAWLNQLYLTATTGALLPQTILYQASDHKRRHDNDKLFAATKRLKIAPHKPIHTGQRPTTTGNPIHRQPSRIAKQLLPKPTTTTTAIRARARTTKGQT